MKHFLNSRNDHIFRSVNILNPIKNRTTHFSPFNSSFFGQTNSLSILSLTGLALALSACGMSRGDGTMGISDRTETSSTTNLATPSSVSLKLNDDNGVSASDMVTSQTAPSFDIKADQDKSQDVKIIVEDPLGHEVELQNTVKLSKSWARIHLPEDFCHIDGTYKIHLKSSTGDLIGKVHEFIVDTTKPTSTSLTLSEEQSTSTSSEGGRSLSVSGEAGSTVIAYLEEVEIGRVTLDEKKSGTLLLPDQSLPDNKDLSISVLTIDLAGNTHKKPFHLPAKQSKSSQEIADPFLPPIDIKLMKNKDESLKQSDSLVLSLTSSSSIKNVHLTVKHENDKNPELIINDLNFTKGITIEQSLSLKKPGRYDLSLWSDDDQTLLGRRVILSNVTDNTEKRSQTTLSIVGEDSLSASRESLDQFTLSGTPGNEVIIIFEGRELANVKLDSNGMSQFFISDTSIFSDGKNTLSIVTKDQNANTYTESVTLNVEPLIAVRVILFDVADKPLKDKGYVLTDNTFTLLLRARSKLTEVTLGLQSEDDDHLEIISEEMDISPNKPFHQTITLTKNGHYNVRLWLSDGQEIPVISHPIILEKEDFKIKENEKSDSENPSKDDNSDSSLKLTIKNKEILSLTSLELGVLNIVGEKGASIVVSSRNKELGRTILDDEGFGSVSLFDTSILKNGKNPLHVLVTSSSGKSKVFPFILNYEILEADFDFFINSDVQFKEDSNNYFLRNNTFTLSLISDHDRENVTLLIKHEDEKISQVIKENLDLPAKTHIDQEINISKPGRYTVHLRLSDDQTELTSPHTISIDTQIDIPTTLMINGKNDLQISREDLDFLSVSGEKNATVSLSLGEKQLGHIVLDSSGKGTISFDAEDIANFKDGQNVLSILTVDFSGNSEKSSSLLTIEKSEHSSKNTFSDSFKLDSLSDNNQFSNLQTLDFSISTTSEIQENLQLQVRFFDGVFSRVGEPFEVTDDKNTLITTPLGLISTEGEYTFRLINANGEYSNEISIQIERTPPKIPTLSIPELSHNDENQLTITPDDLSRLFLRDGTARSFFTISLDDQEIQSGQLSKNGDRALDLDPSLFDIGTHTLTIKVSDSAGNEQKSQIQLEIQEEIPPDITLHLDPHHPDQPSDITNSKSVTLIARSASPVTDTWTISIRNLEDIVQTNVLSSSLNPSGTTVTFDVESDGDYSVDLLNSKNNLVSTIHFTVDTTAPQAPLVKIAATDGTNAKRSDFKTLIIEGEAFTTGIITFNPRSTDSFTLTYSIDDSGQTLITLTNDLLKKLNDGENIYIAQISDLAGNQSPDNERFLTIIPSNENNNPSNNNKDKDKHDDISTGDPSDTSDTSSNNKDKDKHDDTSTGEPSEPSDTSSNNNKDKDKHDDTSTGEPSDTSDTSSNNNKNKDKHDDTSTGEPSDTSDTSSNNNKNKDKHDDTSTGEPSDTSDTSSNNNKNKDKHDDTSTGDPSDTSSNNNKDKDKHDDTSTGEPSEPSDTSSNNNKDKDKDKDKHDDTSTGEPSDTSDTSSNNKDKDKHDDTSTGEPSEPSDTSSNNNKDKDKHDDTSTDDPSDTSDTSSNNNKDKDKHDDTSTGDPSDTSDTSSNNNKNKDKHDDTSTGEPSDTSDTSSNNNKNKDKHDDTSTGDPSDTSSNNNKNKDKHDDTSTGDPSDTSSNNNKDKDKHDDTSTGEPSDTSDTSSNNNKNKDKHDDTSTGEPSDTSDTSSNNNKNKDKHDDTSTGDPSDTSSNNNKDKDKHDDTSTGEPSDTSDTSSNNNKDKDKHDDTSTDDPSDTSDTSSNNNKDKDKHDDTSTGEPSDTSDTSSNNNKNKDKHDDTSTSEPSEPSDTSSNNNKDKHDDTSTGEPSEPSDTSSNNNKNKDKHDDTSTGEPSEPSDTSSNNNKNKDKHDDTSTGEPSDTSDTSSNNNKNKDKHDDTSTGEPSEPSEPSDTSSNNNKDKDKHDDTSTGEPSDTSDTSSNNKDKDKHDDTSTGDPSEPSDTSSNNNKDKDKHDDTSTDDPSDTSDTSSNNNKDKDKHDDTSTGEPSDTSDTSSNNNKNKDKHDDTSTSEPSDTSDTSSNKNKDKHDDTSTGEPSDTSDTSSNKNKDKHDDTSTGEPSEPSDTSSNNNKNKDKHDDTSTGEPSEPSDTSSNNNKNKDKHDDTSTGEPSDTSDTSSNNNKDKDKHDDTSTGEPSDTSDTSSNNNKNKDKHDDTSTGEPSEPSEPSDTSSNNNKDKDKHDDTSTDEPSEPSDTSSNNNKNKDKHDDTSTGEPSEPSDTSSNNKDKTKHDDTSTGEPSEPSDTSSNNKDKTKHDDKSKHVDAANRDKLVLTDDDDLSAPFSEIKSLSFRLSEESSGGSFEVALLEDPNDVAIPPEQRDYIPTVPGEFVTIPIPQEFLPEIGKIFLELGIYDQGKIERIIPFAITVEPDSESPPSPSEDDIPTVGTNQNSADDWLG